MHVENTLNVAASSASTHNAFRVATENGCQHETYISRVRPRLSIIASVFSPHTFYFGSPVDLSALCTAHKYDRPIFEDASK